MNTTKKSTYLCRLAMKKNYNLFIGLLLAITSLMAQPALAQNPTTVKAADFTDAQILDLLSQAQAAGLGVEQAEKLASVLKTI